MRICLGISGSIAAYRSVDFVKELVAKGHEVRCVLTKGGREFVTPRVLETFSGQRVLSDDVFSESHFSTDHIEAARWAEAFVIFGASANFMARAAAGMADDFLSLQLLAFEGPVVIAPAMNPSMWKNQAVAANALTLKQRGWIFAGPVAGQVACGETGIGHLAPHDEIHAAIGMLMKRPIAGLSGKRVLISAGPMRTAIDPARLVQNRSSGRMGLELARACREAGANVEVLLGPVSPDMRQAFSEFKTASYEGPSDYVAALEALFPSSDVFFSVAAVLDFELIARETKIARASFSESSELKMPLKPVEDIVAKFAKKKTSSQRVIAFAAETGTELEIIERATQKLSAKSVDALIANPVWPGLGPDAEKNQVWILRKGQGPLKLGPAPKRDLARPILEALWP